MRLTYEQKYQAIASLRAIGIVIDKKFLTDTDVVIETRLFLSLLESRCNHGGRVAVRRIQRECDAIIAKQNSV
jgi:hypothetical protein